MTEFKGLVKRLLKDKNYGNLLLFMHVFEVYQVKKYYSEEEQPQVKMDSKTGLEQEHFRFYLMKDNHDLGNIAVYDMKIFLENNSHLTSIFSPMNCINSQKDLNYYLKYLQKKKVIKPLNRKKPLRYILTKAFFDAYEMIRIEERLEKWSAKDRRIFRNSKYPEFFEETVLFGIPEDLTREQIKIIFDSINNIKKISNEKNFALLYNSKI